MMMRWLSRLLHSLASDWRRGRIDAAFAEQEWIVRRGLASERRKLQWARLALENLKREVAEAAVACPWAKEQIAELLEDRLQGLRKAASGEVAAGDEQAA